MKETLSDAADFDPPEGSNKTTARHLESYKCRAEKKTKQYMCYALMYCWRNNGVDIEFSQKPLAHGTRPFHMFSFMS